ncbi:RNA polymerase sigma factor [Lysinibacillus sp. NPDC097287]|uniref:RNA polymerase sigma factor n=1 Tax=Lysinibacillus sp. NPDC097287 TaxID=3364144 RepID=UPI003801286B
MHQQFKQDYEAHSDAIFKYIYYLAGNKELAEDLTQETFYLHPVGVQRRLNEDKASGGCHRF